MNDYIRRAVDLADGWRFTNSVELCHEGRNFRFNFAWHANDAMNQYWIDAVTTQLTRQINQHEKYAIHIEPNKTILCGVTYTDKGFASHHTVDVCEGDDFITNTIKAIVDSGVLSDE